MDILDQIYIESISFGELTGLEQTLIEVIDMHENIIEILEKKLNKVQEHISTLTKQDE